jgi:hypothetical protein
MKYLDGHIFGNMSAYVVASFVGRFLVIQELTTFRNWLIASFGTGILCSLMLVFVSESTHMVIVGVVVFVFSMALAV